MERIIKIVKELVASKTEFEWFEFKENWFEAKVLGEYISALSNAAAINNREFAYFIWGVDDKNHIFTGTNFDYKLDVKGEPLEHFLARQLRPDVLFTFYERSIDEKRIVVLEISAASKTPTSFAGDRFIRIGSSKVNLMKYPEREAKLFEVLRSEAMSLTNVESEYQDMTFEKLFTYYAGKGISLKPETFKKNLSFVNKEDNYNLLAQLLSDNSHLPIRVSIFHGTNKASPLYSVKEFGNTCVLLSLEKLLEYADVINIVRANEEDRKLSRKEELLFDMDAFREALINAFVHNKWVENNAPMVTIFSDRIEILSRGTIPSNQTKEGFYLGESVPVNPQLSDIFLQLRISERSGRGVPKIIDTYGKQVFEFRENSIVVTIPFKWNNQPGDNPRDNSGDRAPLNATQKKMLNEIRNNPNITHPQLSQALELKRTAIQTNISYLRDNDYIKRVGSNKSGYWEVIED